MLDAAARRPARRTIAAFFLLGLFNNLTFVINSASAPSILPGAVGIVYIINCGALATRRPAPPPPPARPVPWIARPMRTSLRTSLPHSGTFHSRLTPPFSRLTILRFSQCPACS